MEIKNIDDMSVRELREAIFKEQKEAIQKEEKKRFEAMKKASLLEEADDEEIEDVEVEEVEDPPAEENEVDIASDRSVLDDLTEKIDLSDTEVEILNNLIDSETDAIADYSKGLNETENEYVRKLLTEILDDESKHLSQLKYLVSLGTDQGYVPKDDEAVDEMEKIFSDDEPSEETEDSESVKEMIDHELSSIIE